MMAAVGKGRRQQDGQRENWDAEGAGHQYPVKRNKAEFHRLLASHSGCEDIGLIYIE